MSPISAATPEDREMRTPSQDAGQTLVTAFQALKGSALQRRALEGLVKALTHHQIREIRSAIEEVNLHCDIFAKLPLEISQIIVQFLPLYQIFQARRVSSKWRHILSSDQTVEPLLRDWFPKRNGDLGLQIPKGLSSESVTSIKAEHMDAYRTGHAFTFARHKWDCFPQALDTHLVAYADGIMAWVNPRDSHRVQSLDLKTGKNWSFLPEARTMSMAIAVSSSMVAALGLYRCDVWTLRTEDHYSLRLPSARQAKIAISGDSLAIVYGPEWDEANVRVDVVTWTLKDKRASSFALTFSCRDDEYPRPLTTMLDYEGESLMVFIPFHSNAPHDKPTHFRYIRASLFGDVLTQGGVENPDISYCYYCSGATVAKEANGQIVIWSLAKHPHEVRDSSDLMLIYYNFLEDRLKISTQVVSKFSVDLARPSSVFYWKDAAYYLQYDDTDCRLRVIDLRDSTSSEAKMDLPISTQDFDLELQKWASRQTLLFGDETFLITVWGPGFCVWCFDANVRMANEDVSYKEQRKNNINRRLLSNPEVF